MNNVYYIHHHGTLSKVMILLLRETFLSEMSTMSNYDKPSLGANARAKHRCRASPKC